MSALTGRPGNICSLVTAPINQNGIDRAKTSKKNFSGDRFRDAIVFEESSSTDCGNGGICDSYRASSLSGVKGATCGSYHKTKSLRWSSDIIFSPLCLTPANPARNAIALLVTLHGDRMRIDSSCRLVLVIERRLCFEQVARVLKDDPRVGVARLVNIDCSDPGLRRIFFFI
jgi:hypothetical protein